MRSKKKFIGSGKNSVKNSVKKSVKKSNNNNSISKMTLKQYVDYTQKKQGNDIFNKYPLFLLDKLLPDIKRLGNNLIKVGVRKDTFRTNKYYNSISLAIPTDIPNIKKWFLEVELPLGERGSKRKLTKEDLYNVGI